MSTHPDARASEKQLSYLRLLLNVAFARRIPSCFDVHHLDRVTRAEASAEIDRLKTALKEN